MGRCRILSCGACAQGDFSCDWRCMYDRFTVSKPCSTRHGSHGRTGAGCDTIFFWPRQQPSGRRTCDRRISDPHRLKPPSQAQPRDSCRLWGTRRDQQSHRCRTYSKIRSSRKKEPCPHNQCTPCPSSHCLPDPRTPRTTALFPKDRSNLHTSQQRYSRQQMRHLVLCIQKEPHRHSLRWSGCCRFPLRRRINRRCNYLHPHTPGC